VHLAAGALVARVLDEAVDAREQGVVLALADIPAGEDLRAALAHQDAAGQHPLAAEALDAQALRVRFAVVLGRGLAFLVSHDVS
jgi:hypothetical protein